MNNAHRRGKQILIGSIPASRAPALLSPVERACYEDNYDPMLSIEIQCEAVLFLHLRNPLDLPGQGTFHGRLIIQVEEDVTVGTIRIVWDVSVRRVDGPRERSQHVTDVPLESESLSRGRHV